MRQFIFQYRRIQRTAQEKQLIEEANRDWRALYPAEAAELDWKQASSELSQADVDARTLRQQKENSIKLKALRKAVL
ncbi:hypothetical protein SGI36_03815 [Providencia rettgeri]|uniref:hypothetical protein n=1 Tax=Providencia TaxID=586 RepID=UPI001B361688|nr:MULTISPECIES: hypothetical protein [Providencia]MBQ0531454.1 hypothetical protein [Providencia rettgeri]WOB88173.1 hypothetical protein P3L40_09925 [Providencia sp. PROV040]